MLEIVRIRVIVEGRVQGVWFRDSTRREAQRSNVAGWVRNLPDGRVEAVFEGEPGGVAQAVEWTGQGPDRALVTSLEEIREMPEGLVGFEIRG